MATYNRSHVLKLAIETVRRQTLREWELLVVGDGCTDDTADVVARFADPRITFWNLTEPCGEQSAPNNAGCERARGTFIAFLNHDDFWTPEHLASATAVLEREPSVDLVYGLNVAVYPDAHFNVWGAATDGKVPSPGVPASAWVFRRELFTRIGPWRRANEVFLIPSQDWLFRALRAGATTQLMKRLSVISFPSANRKGSYALPASPEHDAWFARISGDPDWQALLLAELLVNRDVSSYRSGNSTAVRPFVARAAINAGKGMIQALGWSPLEVAFRWRHRRRGGFIENARRERGLPSLADRRAAGAAAGAKGRGD